MPLKQLKNYSLQSHHQGCTPNKADKGQIPFHSPQGDISVGDTRHSPTFVAWSPSLSKGIHPWFHAHLWHNLQPFAGVVLHARCAKLYFPAQRFELLPYPREEH